MSNIFISYRREDAAAYAGRLCDHLDTLLGEDRIFMDLQDIHPGQNFAQTIDQSIATCTALLVVMGPKWRDLLRARSQEHEKDYVCYEIEAALTRKITVIPVLVGGATMPQLTDLPESLAELPFHQAMDLRDATFKEDCSRLADFLREMAGVGPQPATSQKSRKRRAIWIAGAALATLLLVLALGMIPWNQYHARKIRVQQLFSTAKTQAEFGEYESAFKTYADALAVDPGNRTALDRQADAAMLWLRNFHVVMGENQSAKDVAGPPLSALLSVLDAAFSRTNGHDSRAADILAHLGWAHWLKEHIAQMEFGPAAEQDLRRALVLDPSNVYGNAMLGNWLLQTHGSLEEALRHFAVALKINQQKPWVRQMQLGGMIYNNSPGVPRELIRVVNQMRINAEPIDDAYRYRILSSYSPVRSEEELRETLSAVPADEAWATYLWLDNKQLSGSQGEEQQIRHKFIHASILDLGGHTAEALALFTGLQQELRSKHYNGSMAEHVAAAVKRLSGHPPPV